MKKMKLYTICTDETKDLKEIFVCSMQDDWDVNINYWGQIGGDGNFGTPEFIKLIRRRIEYLVDIIEKNPDEIIIWSDIDIQFFRTCSDIIEQAIENNDILFQAERWPKKEINAGFIVISCNEKTLSFFKEVLNTKFESFQFHDQTAMNEILRENKINFRWDVLPVQFWAMSHSCPPPTDVVMHHANCTIPTVRNGKMIGSIELKLDQLKNIRRYVLLAKSSKLELF